MQRWARLSWKWKGSEGILEDAQTRQFWSSRGRQVYAKLRIILWPTLPCLHSPGSFQGTLNSRKTSWMMQRHPTARDAFTKWLDGKASKAPHGSPDGAESLASHGACSNVESLCQMLLVEKLTWPCLKMASELETPLSCTCSSGRPSKFGASSCRTRSSWPWARHWWRVLSLTRHWAVHYSRSWRNLSSLGNGSTGFGAILCWELTCYACYANGSGSDDPPNWGGSLCNIKKNMRLGMLSAIYNGLVPFPFERCATYVCTTIVWFHLLQRAELWHHTGLTWSANQASQDSACGKVLSPKVSLPWASSWRCVFKTFKSHLDSWQTVRFLQVLGSTGD